MRVGDTCQAHRCAGGGVGSTRITGTELAARNRVARFPASRCTPCSKGRGRLAPARPRDRDVASTTASASSLFGSPPPGEAMLARRAIRPARCVSSEKCIVGVPRRGGADSALKYGLPRCPTDWALAYELPEAAAGSEHARRRCIFPRGGRGAAGDVASPGRARAGGGISATAADVDVCLGRGAVPVLSDRLNLMPA